MKRSLSKYNFRSFLLQKLHAKRYPQYIDPTNWKRAGRWVPYNTAQHTEQSLEERFEEFHI